MILVQLWPYIAHYITEQSKPVVNQSLEANRPGWMESIKLLKCVLNIYMHRSWLCMLHPH